MAEHVITVTQDGTMIVVENGTVTISAAGSINLDAAVVNVQNTLMVQAGATGVFTTPTGQVVTVQNGIVVNIF